LKGDIAKAIADFRKAKNYHIDNLQQLKEIQLINEEIFRKIAPYLSIQ
jgi:DNA uptake protein ComE-like DNA-binding protein